MKRLSLTIRILIVILVVQGMLFVMLAMANLDGLRREIATETRLAAQTARSLVLATIGTMQGAVPDDRLMAMLPERLVPPRHTRIAILDASDGVIHQIGHADQDGPTAPHWFVRMVAPEALETRLPVRLQDRLRGFVHIATDPASEIDRAWRDIRKTLGLAALASVLQTLLILLAVRAALRPVTAITSRLSDIAKGDLSARVGALPQPDLAPWQRRSITWRPRWNRPRPIVPACNVRWSAAPMTNASPLPATCMMKWGPACSVCASRPRPCATGRNPKMTGRGPRRSWRLPTRFPA